MKIRLARTRQFIVTAALAMALLPTRATAAGGSHLGNLDVRVTTRPAAASASALMAQTLSFSQALTVLRAKAPGAVATVSAATGGVEVVRSPGFLSAAAPGVSGYDIVRGFISANEALYGLSAQEIASLHFIGESVSPSGLRMVRVEQMINGVPVFQSETRFTMDRDGRLLRSLGAMAPEATAAAPALTGLISPAAALEAAMADINLAAPAAAMTVTSGKSAGQTAEVAANQAQIQRPVASTLVYFPLAPGVLVPAWSQITFTSGAGDWYTLVDARTGALLWRKDLRANPSAPAEITGDAATAAASPAAQPAAAAEAAPVAQASAQDARFRVYVQADGTTPADSPAPQAGATYAPGSGTQPVGIAPTIVSMHAAYDPTASPNGWLPDFTTGVAGTTTQGNNVHAYMDMVITGGNANQPDTAAASVLDGNGKPIGNPDANGRNRDFLGTTPRDFQTNYLPPPQAGNPEAGQTATGNGNNGTLAVDQFRRGVVTQMFYTCNWFHDRMFEFGFDEASGNFQATNFSGMGLGNDSVQAEVDDGSGTNLGNFSSTPDGLVGRLQAFRFTGPTIDRDGALDNQVTINSLAHGLTSRVIGNAVGLNWDPALGLQEGWADFYALALLNNSNANNPNGQYALLAYSGYKFIPTLLDNYVYGARRFPYCTDKSVNPLTWADVDDVTLDLSGGIMPSPLLLTANGAFEIHNVGELWALTLWGVRSRIIADPAGANGDVPTGNHTTLQLITDALKMTPNNPGFLDARDAILAADAATNGAANEKAIWAGFADRGLGYKAIVPPAISGRYVRSHGGIGESFSVPYLDVVNPATDVTIDDSASNNNGAIDPGEAVNLTVALTNPWVSASQAVTSATATLSCSTPGVTIYDNTATYGAIAPEGQATGDRFLITVATSVTAGQALNFTLTTVSNLGTTSINFTLRAGAANGTDPDITYTSAISPALTIQSNIPRGVFNSLTVPDDFEIAQAKFRVDSITSPAVGDLTMLLKAPNGYGAELIALTDGLNDLGGTAFTNTVIDDTLARTGGNDLIEATAANSPYTKSWLPVFNSGWAVLVDPSRPADPVGQLSRLNGTSSKGTWTALASDVFSAATGGANGDSTLNGWSVILTPRHFDVTPFTPAVSIAGTQTVSGTFAAGGTVTYTVTLTNNGTANQADNAGNEFTEVLPAQLALVSATSSAGMAVATTGTNTVTWDGSLAPLGGSVTITITATISAGASGQTVSAQGTVAYDANVNGSNETTTLTDDPGVGGAQDPTNFDVLITNPVVSNTNDAGAGSLRAALQFAAPGSTVTFAPALTAGGGATVLLTSGELSVPRSLTLLGANLVTVDANQTSRVFSIAPGTTVTIAGLAIANGKVTGDSGGGIINTDATLTVTACTIRNCTADNGGAIFNHGVNASVGLTLRDSTLSGNRANGSGGAVYSFAEGGRADVAVINSTLSGNSAGALGGAIYEVAFFVEAQVDFENSTISANTVDAGGHGSGVVLTAGGALTDMVTANTIFANGASGENIYNNGGQVVSSGYNLADDAGVTNVNQSTGALNATGDLLNTNPLLSPLQNNGGLMLTQALLAGSPAIDQGNPAFDPTVFTPSLTNDERGPGFPRVRNGAGAVRVDIGAYEYFLPTKDDVAFTFGKKAIDIDVLANDVPAAAGGSLTLTIMTQPKFGTATVVNGKIHYVPKVNLPLTGDSFTYQYNDGHGTVATATVTIKNFTSIAHPLDGLITADAAGSGQARHEQSGYLRLSVTKTGAYTGVLTFGAVTYDRNAKVGYPSYIIRGQLTAAGGFTRSILRAPAAPIALTVQYDLASDSIVGTAASTDSAAHAFSSRLAVAARSAPGTITGNYTMLVEPDATANSPRGTGYAAIFLRANGLITFIGKLADGATISSSTYFHPDNTIPFYQSLYPGAFSTRGSARGTVAFPRPRLVGAAVPAFDSFVLDWFKPARPADPYFVGGFALTRDVMFARYVRPPTGTRVLSFDAKPSNGDLVFADGGGVTFDQTLTLATNNVPTIGLPNPAQVKLSFNLGAGLFSGSFINPATATRVSYFGGLFQPTASGSGFFLGASPNNGGSVELLKK